MSSSYQQLIELFQEWRAFERPPLLSEALDQLREAPDQSGAPDYTATQFEKRHSELERLQKRLHAINTETMSRDEHIDWQIVQAEMNGYDFNHRVLKPWVRDPAFYQTLWMEQSDVPDHEGPCNHAIIEVWQYRFPLNKTDAEKLEKALRVIPPLLKQAEQNLTGNARDLWLAGIGNFHQQHQDLLWLKNKTSEHATLTQTIDAAITANQQFIHWLEKEAPNKTGPSGVGKEHYTWSQQHVHLLPFTWQQEVDLLQRELDRAWANLKLEEQRNKHLPPLKAASTPEEYAAMANKAATQLMRFLADKNVMPIKPNMEPALREHLLDFVPEAKRNFFDICRHYDPRGQYCHWYHWFDLAQMRDEPHPSPIRRGPLLYNIWDSKNEGIATGVEEMFMHMGLYDDSPRSREIVWIMLAQRAARGLGSLYAHANEMTMEEASQVHVKWTPRGWMKTEPHLLKFEQHLYLRQPGYGTSYVVGKYLIERLMAQKAEQMENDGKEFVMKEFFREFNGVGCVPVALLGANTLGIR